MRAHRNRKQVLLFLIAVIFPSLVLVALTLRMMGQERELAGKRWADERRRLAGEIGQQLLVRLEKIKLREVSALERQTPNDRGRSYLNPEVVLVAWVENHRFVLPWEVERNGEEFRRLLSHAEFAEKIGQAENEEFARKRFVRAAELYREAMNAARYSAQAAYARLLLARALAKAGRRPEAQAHYRRILLLPSQVSDEHGISLALYAAGRLLEDKVGHQEVLEHIRAEVATTPQLSPVESYLLRDLAGTLVRTAPGDRVREAAQAIHRKILEHIRYLDQAVALQKDFPQLRLAEDPAKQSQNREPVWIPYGEETWLVTLAPALTGSQTWALAVQAEEIFSSLAGEAPPAKSFPGEIRFLTDGESEGESLGENFPGLKAAFIATEDPATTAKWNLASSFYLVTLLLVLSVTLFGAYLLWRDVRRELGLAEMRSQFVSSVSHELKTPLTAIRMFAETLRLGRSRNPQIQAEYLETIVNESERLTRLLNNVLDFSKIEQGTKIYRPQPTSLAEIVQAAARALRYPLAQQGFDLRVETADGMPQVQVDRDAIEQAILNLLTNAMKYSGDSRRIDLRLSMQDGLALIQVTDRGVGIDPKEQAHIFDKFYRALTPENQLIPGTGLGLALVAHIAKAHGGRVKVQSEPGKGSTFSIHLPLEMKG